MENTSVKRSAIWVAGALSLAGGLFASAAYAADPRFDEATDLVTKAVAVLKAANAPPHNHDFEEHRKAAVELLTRAQSEILKAKQAADAPAKPGEDHDHKEPKDPGHKEPKDPGHKGPANRP